MTKSRFIWLLAAALFILFLAGQYTHMGKIDHTIGEGSRTITDMKGRSFNVADPIFSHVSFTLDPGEVFCLLRPNGAGKSTLLKSIAQLLSSPTGRVVLDTDNLGQLPSGKIAKLLGFVPQSLVSAFPF